MAKYNWESQELKSKANKYDWFSVCLLLLAAIVFVALHILYITVFVLVFVLVLQIYTYRLKQKDKSIKRDI